jgi:GPH family glycoside/pentoside/hexuronide:cation symporter
MSQETLTFEEHTPKSSKLAYAFTNAAHGLLSGLGLGQIDYYYTEKFFLNQDLVAISWIIFMVWNAVNDPLIGILQERTKSKLGRRMPYLRYGAPIYGLLFILVWFPFFPSSNQIGLFFNHVLMLFLFDTIYSMIGLVTYSLPAEMAITSKERSSIMIYSTMIGFFSTIMGFVLPMVFLSGDKPVLPWQIFCLFLTGVCVTIIIIGSYHIKENRWAQEEETLGFFASIKACVKNKPFLILEIAIFAMVTTQTVLTSKLLYLWDYILKPGIVNWMSYLYFGPVIAMLILAIFGFNKLTPKLGLKKLFRYGMALGAVGFAILPFFERRLEFLFMPLMLIIIALAAIIMTNQPLMADVIDNDEVLTGKRRETTYSGVNALITKPAISIANALFFFILGRFGYDSTLEDQPASVADGVIMAFTVIPVICAIVIFIVMKFYKLDGQEWMAKKKMLHERHIQKEKEFVEQLMKEEKLKDALISNKKDEPQINSAKRNRDSIN